MNRRTITLFIFLSTLSGIYLNRCHSRENITEADRYLIAVKRFADNVIEHGRDKYGTQQTLLFADGLQVDSLTPAIWKGPGGQDWVLSNFASQQSLMRLLDGLSVITNDDRYRKAAEDATQFVLSKIRTPNGLLYWGGHTAWDLNRDTAIGGNAHELKENQPYFQLMWRVDSASTRKLMETIWFGHVINWQLIDYNRHASSDKEYTNQWDHEFLSDIEVPFPTEESNLSFCNVTPSLVHSGLSLAILGNHKKALTWSHRLCMRWQQARDSITGLSGGQLSYFKDRGIDRAQIAIGHVHPNINEAKIVADYHQSSRYHILPLVQMQAAEMLNNAGGKFADVSKELIEWASNDLKIYAEQCYDPRLRIFVAKMTDGTTIQWQQTKDSYYAPESFSPKQPDGYLLWGYAMAYRLTRDISHWEMVRNICKKTDLGDPGNPDAMGDSLNFKTSSTDWLTIYALLEMYESMHDRTIIRLACKIADNLLAGQTTSGLFPRPGRKYARTADEVPLSILHLAAAIKGKRKLLPDPIIDNAFFHAVYYGKLEPYQEKRADSRTYDNLVFYGDR